MNAVFPMDRIGPTDGRSPFTVHRSPHNDDENDDDDDDALRASLDLDDDDDDDDV
jgi:hypothetical protein